MINFSRFLFISLLVLTVIFGLEQLSYENNVFADTRLPCCNQTPIPCAMGRLVIVMQVLVLS